MSTVNRNTDSISGFQIVFYFDLCSTLHFGVGVLVLRFSKNICEGKSRLKEHYIQIVFSLHFSSRLIKSRIND